MPTAPSQARVGEAKRRGFWSAGAVPVAATTADILYPGDEAKLLHQVGSRPEHCRQALGHALFDLVTGRSACGDCGRSFSSLDDLGAIVVAHVELNGRLDRNSPSWSICRECVDASDSVIGTPKPMELANRLVHEWFCSRGAKRLPHPAERRR